MKTKRLVTAVILMLAATSAEATVVGSNFIGLLRNDFPHVNPVAQSCILFARDDTTFTFRENFDGTVFEHTGTYSVVADFGIISIWSASLGTLRFVGIELFGLFTTLELQRGDGLTAVGFYVITLIGDECFP